MATNTHVNRLLTIACLLLSLSSLSRCATVSKTISENPEDRAWAAEGNKRGTISGTGFISWKTKQENIAAPGVLILEAPDKLRLEVQDPAGGVHALLILNGTRFFWFGAKDPTNLVGPVSRLRALSSVSLSGEYLVRALSADIAPQGFRPVDNRWEKNSGAVVEKISENSAGDLEEWSAENPKSGWRAEASYEDYAVRFGVSVPQVIKVELLERGEFKSALTWKWTDLRLEGAADDKLLQISSGPVFGKSTKQLK